MSIGAVCHQNQGIFSSTAQNGAQVALVLTEYERENDNCPLWFEDDYRNSQSGNILKPLRAYKSSAPGYLSAAFVNLVLSQLIYYLSRHVSRHF